MIQVADTNIFKSNSQYLHAMDAASIKPIWDRILVRDIPDENKIGSIWIPETAAERGVGKDGLIRLGLVVAIGAGDKFTREWVERDHLTGTHQVMRKGLGACEYCAGCGQIKIFGKNNMKMVTPATWSQDDQVPVEECPVCHGDGVRRWPMYCKPGDTVVYDRRKESELFIEGCRYAVIHEEQAVFAILEP